MAGNPELSPTLHAFSALRKSGMSTTLPRNFAPLSSDSTDLPRTPDQTFAELELPPPPPHSTYRVRRPRIDLENFSTRNNALPATLFASELAHPSSAGPTYTNFSLPMSTFSSDDLLPSIETPTIWSRPPFSQSLSEPMSSDRLRLPMMQDHCPRTPPAQTTKNSTGSKQNDWDMQRAASACSRRSDSSLSTNETFETRPTSFDGSVTSPDCDGLDPFSPSQNIKVIPATPSRRSKKIRFNSFLTRDKVEWTIEMDNHLFNVYQMYLADPTVTPFKTVPGSIPPTGVCHRVSRRAKETWPRASRIDVPLIRRYKVRSLLDVRRPPRDKTPEIDNFLKTDENDGRPQWPSENATRKRLKQLCREKFTISAHYNRLRESRSPSPFTEQFVPRRPSTRLGNFTPQVHDDSDLTETYATRELGISLVASGATAPLAQLVTGDSPPLGQSDNWLTAAPDSAEKMNVSPAHGLGIKQDSAKLAAPVNIPRLASPFSYSTWNGPIRPTNLERRHISQNQFDTIHATGSRLLSPFRLEPDLSLNANKRRAQHNLEDELSPSGSSLAGHTSGLNLDGPPPVFEQPIEPEEDIFSTNLGDIGQRRFRMRNRGATLGSAHERIERLFSPLSNSPIGGTSPVPGPKDFNSINLPLSAANLLLPPIDQDEKRLGSPFELDPSKRSIRNRSPRHLPSLSDPFIQYTHGLSAAPSTPKTTNKNIPNISERLALFSQRPASREDRL